VTSSIISVPSKGAGLWRVAEDDVAVALIRPAQRGETVEPNPLEMDQVIAAAVALRLIELGLGRQASDYLPIGDGPIAMRVIPWGGGS
jgi:hypothetical protein